MHKLNFKIKLKSAAVISDFTKTKSEIFIPSNTVIGILGYNIFKSKKMENIYDDDDFWNWIFNADLKIGNAFPSDDQYVYMPAPMNLEVSRDNDERIFNVFKNVNRDKKNKINYPVAIDDNVVFKKQLEYITNFHFGRRRDSPDKDIFYLEAIKAGTEFSGDIMGPEEELNKLIDTLGGSFPCRVGKSKNTQYGSALFEFDAVKKLDKTVIKKECNIEFISNTLFYNKFGMAVIDLKVIETYFSDLFNTEVSIISSAIKTGIDSRYITHWKSDSISEQVILPRSVVRLKLKEQVEIDSLIIGEQQSLGYGRFILIPENNEFIGKKYIQVIKKPDRIPSLSYDILSNYADQKLDMLIVNKALKDAKAFNKGKIPNSIIGNFLMSLSKGVSEFKESFKEKIDREIFQIKLDRVRNKIITLDQHIVEMNKYDFKLEINQLNVKALLNNYKIGNKDKLLKIYWDNFFRYMMKSNGGNKE